MVTTPVMSMPGKYLTHPPSLVGAWRFGNLPFVTLPLQIAQSSYLSNEGKMLMSELESSPSSRARMGPARTEEATARMERMVAVEKCIMFGLLVIG